MRGTVDEIRQSSVVWINTRNAMPEEISKIRFTMHMNQGKIDAKWNFDHWDFTENHQYTIYNHRPEEKSQEISTHGILIQVTLVENNKENQLRKIKFHIQLSIQMNTRVVIFNG